MYFRIRPKDLQSNPSIPPILGLTKKQQYSENGVLGVIYNLQNPYFGLENGIGRGGIGRGGIEGDPGRLYYYYLRLVIS